MDAWTKLGTARVATMATVNPDGSPHVVPVVFALLEDRIATAIDAKPKSSTARLRRLTNIEANPMVSLLAHHYEEDWSRLWWVRADGRAEVRHSDETALTALQDRYPQYAAVELTGPVISIRVTRIRSWTG